MDLLAKAVEDLKFNGTPDEEKDSHSSRTYLTSRQSRSSNTTSKSWEE